MLRWLPVALATFLVVPAVFTVVRAPSVFTWKLAILAGEFGHVLALGLIAFAGWSLGVAGGASAGGQAVAALIVVGAAAIAYVRPAVMADLLGRTLDERLTLAFGPAATREPPFAYRRLVGRRAPARTALRELECLAADGRTRLPFDLHFPADRPPGSLACVVVIHGGGWDGGDRRQLEESNRRIAAMGYAVAAVTYRLAPAHPWPAARDDIVAVLSHLRAQAPVLGLDPERMALLGRSAGGQLATAVAYGCPELALRAVIALYAPHDLHFAWAHSRQRDVLGSFRLMRQYLGGSPAERPAEFDAASGYLAVRTGVPPTLLVHGTLDSLVWYRQSERLAAKLSSAGVPHLLLSLPWATHAFDFNPDGPGGQLALHAIRHVLEATLATRNEGSRKDG